MGLPNYDVWKLSPQNEAKAIDTCDNCKSDIYEGDEVLFDNEHHVVYCSKECFKSYVIEFFDDFIDVIKEAFDVEEKQMS